MHCTFLSVLHTNLSSNIAIFSHLWSCACLRIHLYVRTWQSNLPYWHRIKLAVSIPHKESLKISKSVHTSLTHYLSSLIRGIVMNEKKVCRGEFGQILQDTNTRLVPFMKAKIIINYNSATPLFLLVIEVNIRNCLVVFGVNLQWATLVYCYCSDHM